MKSLVGDLVVTCGKIEDTPESTQIHPSDGKNYGIIAVVLLPIACLLLFVAIVVKYCMKRRLIIPCLLLNEYNETTTVQQ